MVLSNNATHAQLRHRIEELEQLLGIRDVMPTRIPNLKRQDRQVLGLMLKREFVSHAAILIAANSACDANTCHIIVARINRVIKPLGARAENVHGEGWFLSPAAKEIVRKAFGILPLRLVANSEHE